MRRLIVGTILLVVGFVAGRLWQHVPVYAEAQGEGTPSGNGDVNGDGKIDISDGVYILNWLFAGGRGPVPIVCRRTGLPATGQTKCYKSGKGEIDCESADFPGQDGFYQAGCPTEGRA